MKTFLIIAGAANGAFVLLFAIHSLNCYKPFWRHDVKIWFRRLWFRIRLWVYDSLILLVAAIVFVSFFIAHAFFGTI